MGKCMREIQARETNEGASGEGKDIYNGEGRNRSLIPMVGQVR